MLNVVCEYVTLESIAPLSSYTVSQVPMPRSPDIGSVRFSNESVSGACRGARSHKLVPSMLDSSNGYIPIETRSSTLLQAALLMLVPMPPFFVAGGDDGEGVVCSHKQGVDNVLRP
jgi:hypothetical protein